MGETGYGFDAPKSSWLITAIEKLLVKKRRINHFAPKLALSLMPKKAENMF